MTSGSSSHTMRRTGILFTLFCPIFEGSLEGPALARQLLPTLLFAALVAGCSRPAQTTVAAQAPPPFEYVDTWGSHGDGPGQFDKPVAMASDGESIIYIADAATGFIHKFSPSGEPRLSFQDDRTNLRPADIAVDAGAAIYVADGRRGSVAIFFSDGMRHRELRTGAPSAVRESLHIAVDAPHPAVYVWGLDGAFRMTQALSAWVPGAGSAIVRKIVVTPAGDLLLLDTAAGRVFRFRLHL